MSENQSLFKDWLQHSLFTFSNQFMLLGSKSCHLHVFHEAMLDVCLVTAQNHQKILIAHCLQERTKAERHDVQKYYGHEQKGCRRISLI